MPRTHIFLSFFHFHTFYYYFHIFNRTFYWNLTSYFHHTILFNILNTISQIAVVMTNVVWVIQAKDTNTARNTSGWRWTVLHFVGSVTRVANPCTLLMKWIAFDSAQTLCNIIFILYIVICLYHDILYTLTLFCKRYDLFSLFSISNQTRTPFRNQSVDVSRTFWCCTGLLKTYYCHYSSLGAVHF